MLEHQWPLSCFGAVEHQGMVFVSAFQQLVLKQGSAYPQGQRVFLHVFVCVRGEGGGGKPRFKGFLSPWPCSVVAGATLLRCANKGQSSH